MGRERTLVLVLAGGAGGRLQSLTDDRAKPAVPFGGSYRLIDVALSNCRHSGLSDVWVIEQVNPAALADHLSNGRPWDLDRTYGGLLILHPHLGDRGGWHQGTADALWRNAGLIREFAPDTLVVLSADAIYRMDYADVVADHRAGGADVTMVTTEVDPADAARYGVVRVDGDGRVTDYAYKPDEPATNLVTTEVFAFDPAAALDTLDAIADELGEEAVADGKLADLGDGLLPRLVKAGGARERRFPGYWRDVGTVPAYWEAHQDLLGDPPPFDLDDPDWPLLTRAAQRSPARLVDGSRVADSLIGPGCRVEGTIERSVLAPGAVVHAGATVRNSVLLPDVVVEAGATVEQAIVDSEARIGRNARVGRAGARDGDRPAVTLIPRRATVDAGTEVD